VTPFGGYCSKKKRCCEPTICVVLNDPLHIGQWGCLPLQSEAPLTPLVSCIHHLTEKSSNGAKSRSWSEWSDVADQTVHLIIPVIHHVTNPPNLKTAASSSQQQSSWHQLPLTSSRCRPPRPPFTACAMPLGLLNLAWYIIYSWTIVI
jgi:hypothetical protein